MLRESLRIRLKDCEYTQVVGEASNGFEAVHAVHIYDPDVVVMDITMPVMNGIEATKRIKAAFPHTAIIGLSMHREREIIEKMWAAGISSFLSKESSSETLCRAIQEAIKPIEASKVAQMKPCPHCQQKAVWRYKEGWGVLACADWFSGKCEGAPLDVSAPSGRDVNDSVTYSNWVKMRLRQLWPLEKPR
jgi:YesN/AraC family two-component response regulator